MENKTWEVESQKVIGNWLKYLKSVGYVNASPEAAIEFIHETRRQAASEAAARVRRAVELSCVHSCCMNCHEHKIDVARAIEAEINGEGK